jgi:Sigma-54 interaction domain
MPMVEERDATRLLELGLTPEEARVLTTLHQNVLLVGMPRVTEAVLRALTPYLRPPVQSLEVSTSLPNRAQGTLILRELETLDWQVQHQLLHWLNGLGTDTQIISLISAPLYPRVEQGTFHDQLYYRLNVVHLEPRPYP